MSQERFLLSTDVVYKMDRWGITLPYVGQRPFCVMSKNASISSWHRELAAWHSMPFRRERIIGQLWHAEGRKWQVAGCHPSKMTVKRETDATCEVIFDELTCSYFCASGWFSLEPLSPLWSQVVSPHRSNSRRTASLIWTCSDSDSSAPVERDSE